MCASLSGSAVIVKKITLPVMTESELDESIYWEAEQYIPFDIQDVNLDYQILDAGTGPDSRGSMEVLLVAAKKEKIGDYTGVIAQAGRTPVIVDVDAFALQNAFEVNYGFDPKQVVVLLNAGASAININILQGGQSRVRPRRLDGRQHLHRGGAERARPVVPGRGAAEEGDTRSTARRSRRRSRCCARSPRTSCSRFRRRSTSSRRRAASDHIDRIVISGGASRVDGFREMLEERFSTPVEEFDPFRAVAWDPSKLGSAAADHAATAAVAVGLALRKVADR